MQIPLARTAAIAASALILAACSETTEENAEEFAQRAAADTEANAEVIEDALREGTIVAADAVSDGAENLRDELLEDEQTDPDQGDGQLDGTD